MYYGCPVSSSLISRMNEYALHLFMEYVACSDDSFLTFDDKGVAF